MADGVDITAGTGTKVATDDAGASGHIQLFKLAYSADGVATLVSADGNGLEVQLGAALPAGSAEIGVVGLNAAALAALESITIGTALPAGSNNIGDVDVASVTYPSTTTNGGTSIGTSAGTIRPSNATRTSLLVQNAHASNVLYVGGGGTVSTANGIRVNPGESVEFKNTATIVGIASAASTDVRYFEEG